MITEDYVSFEVAKLLKEKGFSIPCDSFRGVYVNGEFKRLNPGNAYGYNSKDEIIEVCSLQLVMKWLRENFNMNLVPYATSIGWYFEVFDLTQRDITGCALLYDVGIPSKEYTFDTYEEACEAALKYCLENLI